jgi:hypothetical protein
MRTAGIAIWHDRDGSRPQPVRQAGQPPQTCPANNGRPGQTYRCHRLRDIHFCPRPGGRTQPPSGRLTSRRPGKRLTARRPHSWHTSHRARRHAAGPTPPVPIFLPVAPTCAAARAAQAAAITQALAMAQLNPYRAGPHDPPARPPRQLPPSTRLRAPRHNPPRQNKPPHVRIVT